MIGADEFCAYDRHYATAFVARSAAGRDAYLAQCAAMGFAIAGTMVMATRNDIEAAFAAASHGAKRAKEVLPMTATTWAATKAAAPAIPPETCPEIDSLSTMLDAVSGDLDLVHDAIEACRAKSLKANTADDVRAAQAHIAGLRVRLETLRTANDTLRASSLYWYQVAKALAAEAGK